MVTAPFPPNSHNALEVDPPRTVNCWGRSLVLGLRSIPAAKLGRCYPRFPRAAGTTFNTGDVDYFLKLMDISTDEPEHVVHLIADGIFRGEADAGIGRMEGFTL